MFCCPKLYIKLNTFLVKKKVPTNNMHSNTDIKPCNRVKRYNHFLCEKVLVRGV